MYHRKAFTHTMPTMNRFLSWLSARRAKYEHNPLITIEVSRSALLNNINH
jgi:hypothetical protein